MPNQGYSVGKDISIDLVTQGGVLALSAETGFTEKQKVTDREVTLMNGNTDNLTFYKGWEGTMTFERRGPELDNFMAGVEDRYYAGDDQQPLSIKRTVREPSGQISQFLYTGVQVRVTNAGDWKGDDTVKPTLDWTATRKRKVA